MFKKKVNPVIIISLVVGLLAILIVTGCSSPKQNVTAKGEVSGAVQSNSEGQVTIDVKMLGHQGDTLVFEVAMNTHSVDLDSYDLNQLAMLRDNKGYEYNPEKWDSAAGGHHRSGRLVFNHPDQLAGTLELIIRDVAGVSERTFKW